MTKDFPVKLYPHHVGIFVSDLDRSIQWYEEMLGFKFMFKNDFPLPGHGLTTMAWSKHGDFYLELYHCPDKSPFSMEEYNGSLGTKHISFHVKTKDFGPLKDYLKSKGIDFTADARWSEEYVVKPEGIGVIYFNDPDGIPIEITEWYTPGEY